MNNNKPTKPNNSKNGEEQPYIPAGNGEESGEFTFKEDSFDFCLDNFCLRADLEILLTKEEITEVAKYTNFNIGSRLNKAIKENNLSPYGKYMRDTIIRAINKFELEKPIKIYRGIHVSYFTYINNFYYAEKYKDEITGSTICSTSRTIERAIEAAKGEANEISIVFIATLPKGYKALPVEAIAFDPSEKEILITKPKYTIDNIEECKCENFKYKKIYITIKGD